MESGARILKGSDAPAILCVILLCIMWATPNLDAQTAYEEQFLLNMPEPSVTNVNIGTGGTVLQSFRAVSSYPHEGTFELHRLLLSIDSIPGLTFDIDINIYDGDLSTSTLIYTHKITEWPQMEFIDVETGLQTPALAGHTVYLVMLPSGPVLQFDQPYTLGITVNQSANLLRLATTATDYLDGQSSVGSEIWFKLTGAVSLLSDGISVAESPQNLLYFYPGVYGGSVGAEQKVLSTGGPAEILEVTRSSPSDSHSYEIADPDIATLEVVHGPASDELHLRGRLEGRTQLFAFRNGTLVRTIDLFSYHRRQMTVSYVYVAYPGETQHSLRTAYAEVADVFVEIYREVNVDVTVVDNGEIIFEWDLDGDGQSYEPDGSEVQAIRDQIVDGESYFTNLIVHRENKDDSYFGGSNGGGTSYGFGPDDNPPRFGSVAVHLFRTPYSIADTLAHECGHNLGLAHYSQFNNNGYPVPDSFSNLMMTGHVTNSIFPFQAEILHHTLRVRSELEASLNTVPDFTDDPVEEVGAVAGSSYAASLVDDVIEQDSGDTLAFTKISGPGWLLVAPDGVLSGSPTAGDFGPNFFEVEVDDGVGGIDRAALSIVVSGSGAFTRGDVNQDGIWDISDPLGILFFLFGGGSANGCLDAADSDDNGAVSLSDAIYLLIYLFLEGAAPPEPFPGCGPDPTAGDQLQCVGYASCP